MKLEYIPNNDMWQAATDDGEILAHSRTTEGAVANLCIILEVAMRDHECK